MKKEHKIFLKPNDGVEKVVKKIQKNRYDWITLHIPKDSILKSSLDNFHTIKRESILVGKKVLIESVDKYIEEIAERADLQTINPIFGHGERFISDVIPRGSEEEKIELDQDSETGELSKSKEEKTKIFFDTSKKIQKNIKKHKKIRKNLSPVNKKKRILITTSVIFLLIIFGFLSTKILPKADITLTLQKKTITFEETIEAKVSIYEALINNNRIILPGEMFIASQNMEKKFPASGEENIEEKATGEIYIYNEFSSLSQILVVDTRFVSPDGKVFRLDERVTVPGAEIINGSISPSRIKVSVIADKSGEEYNINPDPNKKWDIPGFKEAGLMKRYEGFYAKPINSMEGGYSGIAKVPTENDIINAEKEIKEILKNTLENQIMVANSKDFKVLDNAKEFTINQINVDKKADENGSFGVFVDGEIKMFVFGEDILKKSLINKNDSLIDFEFNIIQNEILYENEIPDWENDKLTFTTTGSFVLEPKVDENNLKAQLVGQVESVIKSIIFSIPGLEKAKVSLWPFWVNEVPGNPNKINIKFE